MTLYAYADETEFKRSEIDLMTIVGTGIFISDIEIDHTFIHEAMNELQNDEEKCNNDILTLRRGYFHASEDSKNAHSYICRAINKNLSGCFRYSFYERINQKYWEKYKSTENLNRLTLGLSTLEFFDSKINKVVLTIENRNGFEKPAALQWINNWYKQIDLIAYAHPTFLTYYPDIEIRINDKTCPGLQVTDFILWTLNRANKTNSDNTWKSRLNFKFYSDFSEKNGVQSGGDYHLNNFSIDNGINNYPFKISEIETNDDFYNSYLIIEQTVRQLCKMNLPEHVWHLKSILTKINKSFDNNEILTQEKLSLMVTIFIRFFDTLPIYDGIDDTDELKWSLILKAKKLAGLLLRNDLIHGVRSSIAILRWRMEFMKNNNETIICT